MRISDWSSDVCSSDLSGRCLRRQRARADASCGFPFCLGWIGLVVAAGSGAEVGAGAAIFHEVADEVVHRGIVGAVNDGPVSVLLLHQAGFVELGEVEGEG